jgi:hypothetical protein
MMYLTVPIDKTLEYVNILGNYIAEIWKKRQLKAKAIIE